MRKLATPIFLLTLVLALSAIACNSNKTAGQNVDDATILTNVKAKIAEDVDMSALDINVDVNLGVVTLAGTVKNDDIKSRASKTAKQVDGVKSVKNNLQVQANP